MDYYNDEAPSFEMNLYNVHTFEPLSAEEVAMYRNGTLCNGIDADDTRPLERTTSSVKVDRCR